MTKLRVLMFGLVSAAMLAWALPAMAHPARVAVTTVKVTAGKPSEFHFTLSAMSVKHGAVTFVVTDKGALGHDFEVCSSPKGGSLTKCVGTKTPLVAPGKTATLKVTFKTPGTYEYLCSVPGHAAAGMKGDIKVT